MARFVASRFGLAGKDELEQVKANVVIDTLQDLKNAYYQKVFMAKDDAKEEAKTKFLEEANTHLGRIEKLIGLYGSNGFSVGSALTWADLEVLEVTNTILPLNANILDGFANILAVRKSVEANANVSAYLKTRPATAF